MYKSMPQPDAVPAKPSVVTTASGERIHIFDSEIVRTARGIHETLGAIHLSLVQILTVLSSFSNKLDTPAEQTPVFPPLPVYQHDYSATSIDELEFELSVRSWNCLKNENIRTVGELCTKTRAQLLRTPNFGRLSLREIEQVLQSMGLKLRDV